MSWVAIPDSFGDDPRLIELGHEAFARLIRLWCYCGRHENDGIINKAVLLELIVEPIVERLVQRGFITIEGETARVVGFLDDNMSHQARQAQRDAARAAGILSGKSRREKTILERTNRSTDRSTSGRTPGPGPEPILRQEPERGESHNPDPPSAGASASPPARTRTKREIHPLRQQYLEDFHEAHKAATGGRVYQWTGRDRAALDRYCAEIKPDVWKAACAAYSSRSVEWLFRNGQAPDLGSFYRNLNAFAASATPIANGPIPGGMLDTAQRALANLKRMQSHGVA